MENNANVGTTGADNPENNNPDIQTGVDTSLENQNSPDNQQPTQAEIATAYLKENGFQFETLEDLKKIPEKIIETKEVNPYEDILDDDDKAYLNAKKIDPSLNRKSFEAININVDELPKLQLAREKVRKESGLPNLSDAQADEYLSDTLGIDTDEISGTDEIKLAQYTKSILEEKKAEQEKYRKPAENKQSPAPEGQQPEYVRLENGSVMLKTDYENLSNNRLKEINDAKEAVNSVTASSFEVVFDDNGTEKKEAYGYDFDDNDRHSMVSIVSDVDAYVASRYRSENGFNHKQFSEDMFWSDPKNREKAVASMIHKAVAKNTEEILKLRGNVNFDSHKPLHVQNKEGVKMVSMTDAVKGNV